MRQDIFRRKSSNRKRFRVPPLKNCAMYSKASLGRIGRVRDLGIDYALSSEKLVLRRLFLVLQFHTCYAMPSDVDVLCLGQGYHAEIFVAPKACGGAGSRAEERRARPGVGYTGKRPDAFAYRLVVRSHGKEGRKARGIP